MKPKDPDILIKKLFGKKFEFSEKYLTSDIDNTKIIEALKKRYKFNKVTKVALKNVLYEGARSNNVLRINDECYNKMIEILGIPLEEEGTDLDLMEAYGSSKKMINHEYLLEKQRSVTPKLPEIKKVEELSRLDELLESSKEESEILDKSINEFENKQHRTLESNENNQNMYEDIFKNTVEILKNIIKIETENISEFKDSFLGKKKRTKGVAPKMMSMEVRNKYLKLKSSYRDNLEILLSVRSSFSKKMMVDAVLTTVNSVQEAEPQQNDWTRVYSAQDVQIEVMPSRKK